MRPFHLIYPSALAVAILVSGCQTASNSSTNPSANTNSSPLPPGISTSPIPPGGTPTPGIPDLNAPKNANQPAGTPTPGIPDLKPQQNANTPKVQLRQNPSKGKIPAEQNKNGSKP
jgi:hypothetical protein